MEAEHLTDVLSMDTLARRFAQPAVVEEIGKGIKEIKEMIQRGDPMPLGRPPAGGEKVSVDERHVTGGLEKLREAVTDVSRRAEITMLARKTGISL